MAKSGPRKAEEARIREAYSKWQPYPKPKETRVGMKVSWNYYETLAEAEECAKAAKVNAQIQLSQGYDFGYCSPGSIYGPGKQGFFPDLYEVCLP